MAQRSLLLNAAIVAREEVLGSASGPHCIGRGGWLYAP